MDPRRGRQPSADHKIISSLVANGRQRETVEERICEWLLDRIDSADGEAAQHFSVVRDAILEGKHRG